MAKAAYCTAAGVLVLGAILAVVTFVSAQENTGEFYFWRLGHMDGPHDASKALGISRDGKVAVGSTLVVDFDRAWRCDIEWAIATDDGVPPLYNELFVQEDIGVVAPSQFSAAYAASDMLEATSGYDLPNADLDWGLSTVVGTLNIGKVSYAIQWLEPVLDELEDDDYAKIADFGGGLSEMRALDITSDGSIMVGYGNNKRGRIAFYADMSDPTLPVVYTLTITDTVYSEQTLRWTVAEAISADGTLIAGYGGTKRGNRAFVTEVTGFDEDDIVLENTVVLPCLDGGKFSEAYALTTDDDGAVYVAGRSDSPKGPQACIWFKDTTDTDNPWVVKGLGALSKKKLDSMATGIACRPDSEVGELIVVGKSKTILYDSEAFVWTGNPVVEDDDVGYMYDLEYIITKTGAGEISTMGSQWILTEATGVACNDEETRIVGWGVNPEGGVEAWLTTGFPYDEPDLTHEE